MEYKTRLVHTKKRKKVDNKKANGFKRITVRGRKRWVKVEKKAA